MSDGLPEGGAVVDTPQPPKKGGRLPKLGPKAPKPKKYGPRAPRAQRYGPRYSAPKYGPRRAGGGRGRQLGPRYSAPKYGPKAPRLRRFGPKKPRKPGVRPAAVRSVGGRRGGRSMGLSGWWRLLKRLAKAASRSPGSDFRNHGATGSGKGGKTGRAGFHGPRGRLF